MEGTVLVGDGVLGERARRGHHLVEGSYAVSGLEFEDGRANRFDNASYVVACVGAAVGLDLGRVVLDYLPVFGVCSGYVDFDEDVEGGCQFGDGAVENLDREVWKFVSFGGIWFDFLVGGIGCRETTYPR